jgi:hypothetical protein
MGPFTEYGTIGNLFGNVTRNKISNILSVIANANMATMFYKDQSKHTRDANLGFGHPFGPLMGECLGNIKKTKYYSF